MSTFLLRVAEVVAGVVVFDGLIVAFLALSNTVGPVWNRLYRRAIGETADFADWERELSRSARETSMRQHPAGGSR